LLGLAHHFPDGSTDQIAAQGRNDAEAAAMVAALGDLQVRIVARRQFHALCRYEIQERLVRRRQVLMYRRHDLFIALRTGYFQHLRVAVENLLRLRTQATGDDDFAVFGQCLSNGVQGLVHCGVDKTAGVHDHEVGFPIRGGDLIALRTQAGEYALGVDQGLRAAQTHEAHFGALTNCGFQRTDQPRRGIKYFTPKPPFGAEITPLGP
jgi:hypothetical protein